MGRADSAAITYLQVHSIVTYCSEYVPKCIHRYHALTKPTI